MSGPGRRCARASRLAAVQALYQIDRDPACRETVLAAVLETGALLDEEGRAAAIDRALTARVVEGAAGAAAGEIDAAIGSALAAPWRVERLESLMRAVLRAGIFELLDRPGAPAPVVIDDYVGIAHAFWERGEPGMVNAVLDRMARHLRPGELAPKAPAGG